VRPRWIAWLGALGTGGTALTRARTATYAMELPAETERTLSVVTGQRAQALRLLMVSVQSLEQTLTRFGTGPTDKVRVYGALLARPRCARALGRDTRALLARCLSPVALRAVLGDRALLLEPLVTAPSIPRFLQRQAATRARKIARNEAWQIVVRRKAPDFSRLVGTYTGTTRTLVISSTGLVTERVSATVQPPAKAATPPTKGSTNGAKRKPGDQGKPADQGKSAEVAPPKPVVKPVIQLVYQLGYPTVRGGVSRVQATVVRVVVRNPSLLAGPAPRVGATGTLSLAKGVLRPPFLQVSYCGRGAAKNACA
jgi:hypothetical protein